MRDAIGAAAIGAEVWAAPHAVAVMCPSSDISNHLGKDRFIKSATGPTISSSPMDVTLVRSRVEAYWRTTPQVNSPQVVHQESRGPARWLELAEHADVRCRQVVGARQQFQEPEPPCRCRPQPSPYADTTKSTRHSIGASLRSCRRNCVQVADSMTVVSEWLAHERQRARRSADRHASLRKLGKYGPVEVLHGGVRTVAHQLGD